MQAGRAVVHRVVLVLLNRQAGGLQGAAGRDVGQAAQRVVAVVRRPVFACALGDVAGRAVDVALVHSQRVAGSRCAALQSRWPQQAVEALLSRSTRQRLHGGWTSSVVPSRSRARNLRNPRIAPPYPPTRESTA